MESGKQLKVAVVGWGTGYARFLNNYKIVDFDEAEIAIFTGGEDVNPALYGAKAHPTTYFTGRDRYEVNAYKDLVERDNIKLLIGICRGAQLACALNGGLLIQDVANHAIGGGHKMRMLETGREYDITSLHHQMLYPFNLPNEKYTILAESSPPRSPYYEGDLIDPDKVTSEIEMILFHGEKPFFGVQGHPEMMFKEHETVQMINEEINKILCNLAS